MVQVQIDCIMGNQSPVPADDKPHPCKTCQQPTQRWGTHYPKQTTVYYQCQPCAQREKDESDQRTAQLMKHLKENPPVQFASAPPS